jgi:putative membrane protein
MMYNWGHMGGSSFGFFGAILMVLFWVLIIWAVVALIRGSSRHHCGCCGSGDDRYCNCEHGKKQEIQQNAAPEKNTALEILKERYAKGEIGKGEFEEKKKDII